MFDEEVDLYSPKYLLDLYKKIKSMKRMIFID